MSNAIIELIEPMQSVSADPLEERRLAAIERDVERLNERVKELCRLRNCARACSRRRRQANIPWHRVTELLMSS